MTVQPSPDHAPLTRPTRRCPAPGSDGEHRWRHVGAYRGERPSWLSCWRPVAGVCRGCAQRVVWRCKTRHEGRCQPCGEIKRRRVARLVHDGLARRIGSGGGQPWTVGMLTLTAPGRPGHRRFVPGKPGNHGICNCAMKEHSQEALGLWNASASQRWNHLRTVLRREYPGLEFFRAVEVQQRGALHLHVMLGLRGQASLALLQQFALAAGFGCVIDWSPVEGDLGRRAGYLAKYVTKEAEPGDVPWQREHLDKRTGELTTRRDATYRAWSASREWGMTMLQLEALIRDAARAAEDARHLAADPRPEADSDRWPVGGGGLPPSTG